MVVVVNTGTTNRRSLVVAVDNLTRIGAKVLGLAVNQLRAGEGMLVSSKGYGSYGNRPRPAPTSSRTENQEQDPLRTQW